MSNDTGHCQKCGGPIPPEAPQGLCPRCLLAVAALATETGAGSGTGSAAPEIGELAKAFPQLEILELIGQGGMGFVYKARQPKLDRFVALKILPQSLAASPAFAERFTREGRVLARLSHPNIVTIHDFGEAGGFFYLLMEFVDGVNLRQAMRAGRFTADQALAIVPKICEALQFAHNEGVLHRDIKPENIMLDSRGRVKIADFGIAKLVGESAVGASAAESPAGAGAGRGAALTETGRVLGTPQYMAPEQVEHPGQADHRADIYSLGVVFYEMLTGELPLGRFAPPSQKSAADPRLDEVVLKTLEKEPERRTQTAGEVKTQVETIARTQGKSSAESQATSGKPNRTWQVAKALFFLFAAICALISAVMWFYRDKTGLGMLWIVGFVGFLIAAIRHWPGFGKRSDGSKEAKAEIPTQGTTDTTTRLKRGGILMVGQRGGKRAVVLNGVVAVFFTIFGCALVGVLLARALFPISLDYLLGVSVFIAVFLTLAGLAKSWQTPVGSLIPLDSESGGGGRTSAPASEGGRGRKIAAAVVAGLLLLTALVFQAPRYMDTPMVVHSPIDIPGGQLTASGVTIGAMRILGGDQYKYRFTIQDSAGRVLRETDLPVPFDNDKLRTDPSIVGGPLPDYYFGTHGRIEWQRDGSAVKFSMRGVELMQLQVDRFFPANSSKSFGPVRERVVEQGMLGAGSGQLSNCWINFKTGELFSLTAEDNRTPFVELEARFRQQGVDATCVAGVHGPVLKSFDQQLRFVYLPELEESQIVSGDVPMLWNRRTPKESTEDLGEVRFPQNYVFKRRDGNFVFLQLTGLSENSTGLKLRCKLVQDPLRPIPPEAAELLDALNKFNSEPPTDPEGQARFKAEYLRREEAIAKLLRGTVAEPLMQEQEERLKAINEQLYKNAGDPNSISTVEYEEGSKKLQEMILSARRQNQNTLTNVNPEPGGSAIPGMEFGPVVERVLQARQTGTNAFLDLDGGELLTPSPAITNGLFLTPSAVEREQFWRGLDIMPNTAPARYLAWLKESGSDLMNDDNRRVIAFDGTWAVAHGTNSAVWDEWEGLTPEMVRVAIAIIERAAARASSGTTIVGANTSARRLHSRYGGPVVSELTRDQSSLWFFKTREGSLGILQIIYLDDNPHIVKLRYKLVKYDHQPAPTPEKQN